MALRYVLTAEEPIALELSRVKDYLRVDGDVEDELLTLMLNASVRYGEHYTGRDFRVKSWSALVNCFPQSFAATSYHQSDTFITLRRSQIDAVTEIAYTDELDQNIILSAAIYTVEIRAQEARVHLVEGAEWPTDVKEVAQPITIKFTTEAPEHVEDIEMAILRLVTRMYSDRGDCQSTQDVDHLMTRSGAASFFDFHRIARI